MKKFTIAFTAVMAIALLLTWISVAYAEEYIVEITDTGFIPTNSTINYTDSLGFVSSSTSDWIIDSELLLGGMHVINSQGNTWSGFNCGVFTVVQHKNYGDNLGLTPFTLVVENCPQPEITIETTFTSETTIPDAEDVEVFDIPLETIPEEEIIYGTLDVGTAPLVETETIEVVSTQTPADNETLNLRLEILKVLESILAILFGR